MCHDANPSVLTLACPLYPTSVRLTRTTGAFTFRLVVRDMSVKARVVCEIAQMWAAAVCRIGADLPAAASL